MKMKRVIAAFTVLLVSSVAILSCKKETPNVAPEPDTEVQTAREASFAFNAITDIDMVCSYIAENQFYTNSYVDVKPDPLTPTNGSITANRDTFATYVVMSWYKTQCVDGKFREGSVFLRYNYDPTLFPNQNRNSRYYREAGFAGKFTLTDYYVDGWKIENVSGVPAYVYNLQTSSAFNPREVQLKWYMGGKFKFTKVAHPDTTMTVEFRLNKTLANSTSTLIYAGTTTNKNFPIMWSNGAILEYDGDMTGTLTNGESFTYNINKEQPLVRDWKCSPDIYNGVAATATPGVYVPKVEQFHPVKKGVVTFVPGTKYPRQIYYGNEGDMELAEQCDNVGSVLIKGNSYKVTFMK
jgi:hypothetical protein